jgi:hypothetical protein
MLSPIGKAAPLTARVGFFNVGANRDTATEIGAGGAVGSSVI